MVQFFHDVGFGDGVFNLVIINQISFFHDFKSNNLSVVFLSTFIDATEGAFSYNFEYFKIFELHFLIDEEVLG